MGKTNQATSGQPAPGQAGPGQAAPGKIDPANILQRRLYTGAAIPAIGLGTFGSDSVSAAEVAEAVRGAARIGYRHFDCASVYGNEPEIGQALEAIVAQGIRREDLWITSKLWNDRHDDVIASCRQSLADLRLNYLDLYLIHWPFPNFHPPGCDVSSRSPDAKPYIHADMTLKQKAIDRTTPIGGKPGRYQPPDKLIAFLEAL